MALRFALRACTDGNAHIPSVHVVYRSAIRPSTLVLPRVASLGVLPFPLGFEKKRPGGVFFHPWTTRGFHVQDHHRPTMDGLGLPPDTSPLMAMERDTEDDGDSDGWSAEDDRNPLCVCHVDDDGTTPTMPNEPSTSGNKGPTSQKRTASRGKSAKRADVADKKACTCPTQTECEDSIRPNHTLHTHRRTTWHLVHVERTRTFVPAFEETRVSDGGMRLEKKMRRMGVGIETIKGCIG